MNSKLTTTLMIAVSLLLAGGTANAAGAPSVVDQYTEQVPTAGGEKPHDGAGGPGSSGSGNNGSGTGSGETTSTGGTTSTGETATNGGSGGSAGGGSGGQGGSGPGGQGAPGNGSSGGSSGSETSTATNAVVPDDSGDGMGWLFPLLLVAIAVGAIGFVVVRHQGRGTRTT